MRRLAPAASDMTLAGFAAAGVAAAHNLGYLVAAPSHPQRHDLLAETGHGYFPTFATAAVVVAVGAAALAFGRGLRAGTRGRLHPTPSIARPVVVLALLQGVAFVSLEVGERLIAGNVGSHCGELLAVGLALQPVVALAGVLVARLLSRLGEQLGAVLASRARFLSPGVRFATAVAWSSPRSAYLAAPLPPRGPPSLLVS